MSSGKLTARAMRRYSAVSSFHYSSATRTRRSPHSVPHESWRGPPCSRRCVSWGLGEASLTSPNPQLTHRREQGDRESTRLNSSHVAISYAVFCLKKKKQTKSESIAKRD